MEDLVAGFQAAPLWAQIGMVFFAVMAVVMVGEPAVKKRRFRRQFDEIARTAGAAPSVSTDWPMTSLVRLADRPFEIRYDIRQGSGRGSSQRGPHGFLLTTATRLTGTAWPMHQVEIAPVDRWLSKLMGGTRPTGDPDFDGRFMVTQEGVPVRGGWLDGDTRQAILGFFDAAPRPGLVWIQDGELQFIMQDPWTGLDGQAIRGVLERQAVLASALERTGSRRFSN